MVPRDQPKAAQQMMQNWVSYVLMPEQDPQQQGRPAAVAQQ
jgi:hypothetical protein